jgi:hypothetical protein
MLQPPDYVAGFAVYITLGHAIQRKANFAYHSNNSNDN